MLYDCLPKFTSAYTRYEEFDKTYLARPEEGGWLGSEFDEMTEHNGGTLEPKYTNYTVGFKGTLDYIFHADMPTSKFILQRIVSIPHERTLMPTIPNKKHHSDHLSLVAEYRLVAQSVTPQRQSWHRICM